MGERKNPWTSIGYSNYEGFHLMPFDLRSRAERHELNRQRVVSSIFLELYIMATMEIIPKDRLLTVKRALSQNLRGSKKDQTEAAHCAPRQVMIGDRTPTELLQTAFPERAFVVNAFFAETDILPANFNKSDSRAEGNGMSNGFREGCHFVVSDAHYHGKLIPLNAATAVRQAFSIYKDWAIDSFRVSCERLENKLRFKMTKSDEDKWKEQLKITQIYNRTMKISSGASVVLGIERVSGLIKIYEEMRSGII
ncbi:MAG: hypothetical protein R2747_02515 [Pyrinomonadaceae bacterium]